jgi:hypothetical protein
MQTHASVVTVEQNPKLALKTRTNMILCEARRGSPLRTCVRARLHNNFEFAFWIDLTWRNDQAPVMRPCSLRAPHPPCVRAQPRFRFQRRRQHREARAVRVIQYLLKGM